MCSTTLIYKNLTTNLLARKPAFSLFAHLLHITSVVNSTMRRCFFIIETSDRMQFFTILQGKLHSFNIQDDRSTRFLCTANYRIDLIINRFRGDNSIMPGLFSHKNLILCGINYRVIMLKSM